MRRLLGGACAVAGGALTLRPFTSLGVPVVLVAGTFLASGITEIASAPAAPQPWLTRAAGGAWIAGGVVILLWAGITIHALAIVAGISLLLGGLARIAGAVHSRRGERWIATLAGAARARHRTRA